MLVLGKEHEELQIKGIPHARRHIAISWRETARMAPPHALGSCYCLKGKILWSPPRMGEVRGFAFSEVSLC